MDDIRALIIFIIFEHPVTDPNNAQPHAHPATTDMVAKCLIHGALGVCVVRSPEQHQADNQILRNARDQHEQECNEFTRCSQDLDAAFNE